MTDQNLHPNDNYPEENPQGDFGEIGAFQDADSSAEPDNINTDAVPIPDDALPSLPEAKYAEEPGSFEEQQSLGEETSAAESQGRELSKDAESASGGEQPGEQPTEQPAAPSEPWFKEVAGFSGEPTPALPSKTVEPDLHTDFFT
jgi:hypothetical protein